MEISERIVRLLISFTLLFFASGVLGQENQNTASIGTFYSFVINTGVLVRGIIPGSPADVAGLHVDDVLTSINGEILNSETWYATPNPIEALEIGRAVSLSITRDGISQDLTVVPVDSTSLDYSIIDLMRPVTIDNVRASLTIYSIGKFRHIASRQPNNDNFLVVAAEIDYKGVNQQGTDTPFMQLYDIDFAATLDGISTVPSADAMGDLVNWLGYTFQVWSGPGVTRPYPGTQYVLDGHWEMQLGRVGPVPVFLVYDVPANFSQLEITFPSDGTSVALWVNPIRNSNLYAFAPTGEVQIVGWNTYSESVEVVLDTETVSEENCLGAGVRRSSRAISRSVSSEVNIEVVASGELVVPLPLSELQAAVRGRYERNENNAISFERREEFEIPVGTIANYEIIWYLSSIQGEMILRVRDEQYVIPFSLPQRLRADVRSLPMMQCQPTN